ncbi:hypothetical protein DFP72DRAFT_1075716 [Ephemerocybe angulata]|uniref:F-box domain-containing protein n=1 Tax=Ephemerocybe angulata TaxID=980116 RepID=A0A8H6HIZ9_9AGAR|nr:hypothetical protein DFP72DRAFT_1075716 [Tulosesus angulatus]
MASTHPIHDYPIELLARIFRTGTKAILEEWKDQPTYISPPLPLPMVICAVCRTWREVALNSPDLWSTIYVPLLYSDSSPRRLVFDAVKLTAAWLSRSKEAPLDIFLRIPNIPLAYDLTVDLLLPQILQHTRRLRRLLVIGNTVELPFINIRGIVGLVSTHMAKADVSTVHTLALKFQARGAVRVTHNQTLLDRDWDYPVDQPPTFSTSYLSVEGIRFSPSFFPQLVSLSVARLEASFPELQAIFASLPLLQNLHLPKLHVLLPSPETATSIIVPSLRHLSLSFQRRPLNSTSTYPVAHLRLPSLRSLALDGAAGVPICSCFDTPFLSSLGSLERLSLRNFVRFSLDSSSDTTRNDLEILHSLSSIKHLELIRTPPGNLLQPNSMAHNRPRRRSIGHRTAISPQLAETSRTMEGMIALIRSNAGGPHVSFASPRVPIASSSQQVRPTGGLTWPVLETIAMDAIVADDLVYLCQYVLAQPSLKTVLLSGPARRHIIHSVKRRLSDDTFFFTNFYTRRSEWDALKGKEEEKAVEVESAEEWLSPRVRVLPFEDIHSLYDE